MLPGGWRNIVSGVNDNIRSIIRDSNHGTTLYYYKGVV